MKVYEILVKKDLKPVTRLFEVKAPALARKGMVTLPMKEMLEGGRHVDRVWAIGPAVMMKFCALATGPFGVPTVVNLNSIMVDGTGMCGACRVEVGGRTRFACVDGPEFDGHEVDWELLTTRQRIYLEEEKLATAKWQQGCHTEI